MSQKLTYATISKVKEAFETGSYVLHIPGQPPKLSDRDNRGYKKDNKKAGDRGKDDKKASPIHEQDKKVNRRKSGEGEDQTQLNYREFT